MSRSYVIYEKRESVAWITLNRPERLNAISPQVLLELKEALGEIARDEAVEAVVLTGSGRAFSAGVDIKGGDEADGGETLPDQNTLAREVIGAIETLDKPVIAAINGYCFAGGVEIACMCDFRIAADHAEFGVLNRRWNVGLGDGGTQRLWRIVGLGRALELIITGRRIGVEEAERIGLVNEIVPRDRLMARVTELAEQICQLPQGSIRSDKEALMRGIGRPLEEGLRIEAEMMRTLMLRRDSMAEGARAFIEKRRPDWKQHGL